MDILIVCQDKIPSAIQGVYDPLWAYSSSLGVNKLVFSKIFNVTYKMVKSCDVLILVRGYTFIDLNLVRYAKKIKKVVIYYLDDDLLGLDNKFPGEKYFALFRTKQRIKEIISISNAIFVVNPCLLNKIKQYNEHIYIVRSPVFDVLNVRTNFSDKNHTIIGFAGSKDHSQFLNTIMPLVYDELEENYPGKFYWEFVGAFPEKLKRKYNCKFYKYFSDITEYRRFMRDRSWDVAIAPLEDSDFNRCKYYNKYLEYGAYQIPSVYSNVMPYSLIVRNGINGIMADNTVDSWVESILRLALDQDLSDRIAKNAYQELVNKYSASDVGSEMSDLLHEIRQNNNEKHVIAGSALPIIYRPILVLAFFIDRIVLGKDYRASCAKIFRIVKLKYSNKIA